MPRDKLWEMLVSTLSGAPPRPAPQSIPRPSVTPVTEAARVVRRDSHPGALEAWLKATPPALMAQNVGSADYRFADRYTVEGVFSKPEVARAFRCEYLRWEAEYFKQARHPETGLTFDGLELNEAGETERVRHWSAPSKECLDMAVCLKALGGHKLAQKVVGKDQAVEILSRKLDSYERWAQDNPGYGGYLPWFYSEATIRPTDDWQGDCPGLDNGEWVWTMLLAEKTLQDQGYEELAARYGEYNQLLASKAVPMFFDPEAGKVRADVHVVDPSDPNTAYETIRGKPGRMTHLTGEHGVHEGMMMVMYLSLLGQGLPEGAVDQFWDGIEMKRVEHPHGTTWEAFWGSSHESWAHLFLPLRDVKGYRDLFRLREVIRTQNAAERGYPGLATSTNDPEGPGYLDGAGIEGIGSQAIRNNHTFAIYGAFPLLLEQSGGVGTDNYGLAWLLNMLAGPGQQTPMGGGESGTNDGRAAARMKTIDGSLPNVLALAGGLEKEMAAMMRERGVYERFVEIMSGEYEETFGGAPLREPSGFALPTAKVP